jgi:hypothetical protein
MGAAGLAVLIPIVAIVFSLSIPIVAIIADTAKRRKIYELYHRERLAAIEKGIEIPPLPPEFLAGEGSRCKRKPRYLLGGLVWLLVGMAGMVALYFDERQREWALYALIPVAVGVAYLGYWAMEGRKEQDQATANQTSQPSGAFRS